MTNDWESSFEFEISKYSQRSAKLIDAHFLRKETMRNRIGWAAQFSNR
jgi:hypothetical protein